MCDRLVFQQLHQLAGFQCCPVGDEQPILLRRQSVRHEPAFPPILVDEGQNDGSVVLERQCGHEEGK
jgi:hypothetical protein